MLRREPPASMGGSNSCRDVPVVSRGRKPAQAFPHQHHDQEREHCHQRNHPDGNERLLQPLVVNPRRDGVAESKPKRVPDDDD